MTPARPPWLAAWGLAAAAVPFGTAAGVAAGHLLAEFHFDFVRGLALIGLVVAAGGLAYEGVRPEPSAAVQPGWVALYCATYIFLLELSGRLVWSGRACGPAFLAVTVAVAPLTVPAAYFARHRRWRGFFGVYALTLPAGMFPTWNALGQMTGSFIHQFRY